MVAESTADITENWDLFRVIRSYLLNRYVRRGISRAADGRDAVDFLHLNRHVSSARQSRRQLEVYDVKTRHLRIWQHCEYRSCADGGGADRNCYFPGCGEAHSGHA